MPQETEELYLEYDSNLYRIDGLNIPILTKKTATSVVSGLADLGSGSYSGNMEIDGGYIQSSNFKSGSTGWRLDSNGDFEGNNGTFRGTITATSGTIGGWTIGSTTLTGGGVTLSSSGIITGGTIRTSASGARVQMLDSTDSIQVIDSGGEIRVEIDNDELIFYDSNGNERGGIYASATTTLYFHALNGGNIIIEAEGASYGVLIYANGSQVGAFTTAGLGMNDHINMNDNDINGVDILNFNYRTTNSSTSGDLWYYKSGSEGLRFKIDGYTLQFQADLV